VEELDIKDCKVRYLTGLPASVRILKAAGNRLDGLVSFAWGRNIQYLDLANNEIDSLAGPPPPPPALSPFVFAVSNGCRLIDVDSFAGVEGG